MPKRHASKNGGVDRSAHTYGDSREKIKSGEPEGSEKIQSLHDLKPEPDRDPERTYRKAFVRSVPLSKSYISERGGLFTRLGTPRLDLLFDSRAVHLTRKSDDAECPVFEMHTGERINRQPGSFFKSIQSFAEDVWRRIYHRAVPEGNPLKHDDFHRLYRRLQKAVERGSQTRNVGPAVPNVRKQEADRYGRRWQPSDALTSASAAHHTDPDPFVLCTADTPERGHEDEHTAETESADVWKEIERHVARSESLHREFTHATTCASVSGRRYISNGRRYERTHARKGDRQKPSPRYLTIGRWRKDEAERHDRSRCSVTIPWIVAEIDGRNEDGEKCRVVSDRLARQLLGRLEKAGVDLSTVVVSYSGNASIHVRIPHSTLGCPVYRSSRAAINTLCRFFDNLCGADTELRAAIDDACFRPGQLIRAIGGIHEKTGRRTTGATGNEFLEKPSYYLWHLSETQFQYSPIRLPHPHAASPCAKLIQLLRDRGGTTAQSKPDHNCETLVLEDRPPTASSKRPRARSSGILRRIADGVEEGEPWGTGAGRPDCVGRNWAAVFWAHKMLDERSTFGALVGLWDWNRRNSPPLPHRELDHVFHRVRRWRSERWDERRPPFPSARAG